MAFSYYRRKKWEADLLTASLLGHLGAAIAGTAQPQRELGLEELMAVMGAKWASG